MVSIVGVEIVDEAFEAAGGAGERVEGGDNLRLGDFRVEVLNSSKGESGVFAVMFTKQSNSGVWLVESLDVLKWGELGGLI